MTGSFQPLQSDLAGLPSAGHGQGASPRPDRQTAPEVWAPDPPWAPLPRGGPKLGVMLPLWSLNRDSGRRGCTEVRKHQDKVVMVAPSNSPSHTHPRSSEEARVDMQTRAWISDRAFPATGKHRPPGEKVGLRRHSLGSGTQSPGEEASLPGKHSPPCLYKTRCASGFSPVCQASLFLLVEELSFTTARITLTFLKAPSQAPSLLIRFTELSAQMTLLTSTISFPL